MQRIEYIEWDLESTPLEIRTNSVLGSNDQVVVRLYSGRNIAGQVSLRFISTALQYYLNWCALSWTNLPVTPPSANDKVWRITLTKTVGVRVVIHCNEVEVLNTLISEATCIDSGWSTVWTRDMTKIMFMSDQDTASDYYRPQSGD